MGENTNQYWYTNINGGWDVSTLATSGAYTVVNPLDYKVNELEKEVKELRKRISKLATLICTHIGKEQMENFYKDYE